MNYFVKILSTIGSSASIAFGVWHFFVPGVFINCLGSAVGFIGEFLLTLWLLIMAAKENNLPQFRPAEV